MSIKTIESVYALSSVQQGMLYETIQAPESGIHIEQSLCVITGKLSVTAFEQAWQLVIDRHIILRTGFVWKDRPEPLQVALHRVALPLERHDWRKCSSGEQHELLEAFLKEDRRRGFVLSQAPLMRLALFQMADDAYRFVWTTHHILMDGWCHKLILRDVLSCYEALSRGQEAYLEPSRPYKDYLAWLKRQDASRAEHFWRESLQGFVRPTPLGREHGPSRLLAQEEAYGTVVRHLSTATTTSLQAVARRHHLTLNTLLQGVWALLLSRYSGSNDVVFGVTVSGRPAELAGAETMVGLFINTLPLRIRLSQDTSLWSWLDTIQAYNLELRQYEYSPAGSIHGWSEMPGRFPLFESLLVVENYPLKPSRSPSTHVNITLSEMEGRGAQTNYALTLLVSTEADLGMTCVYNRHRFTDAAGEQILEHFQTVLGYLATDPEEPLASIYALLPQEEIPLVSSAVSESSSQAHYQAPRTPIEEVVAAIWCELLGCERVSIEENFFELGGHSLLATQVIARVRTVLQVELPLRSLFEAPTIAGLAQWAQQALRGGQAVERPPLQSIVRAGDLPLSFAQQRLWFLDQLEPGSSAYNIPIAVRLQGTLDIAALFQSVAMMIQRHESLRTTFQLRNDQPVQIIADGNVFSSHFVDLAVLQAQSGEMEMRKIARQEARRLFDLSHGPLLRITLVRLSLDKHILLLIMHHIVTDRWSTDVFIREVMTLYTAFVTGQPSPLPALPLQYADFALWQRQWLQGEVLDEQIDYWRQQLSEPTFLDLPTDHPRSAALTSLGARQELILSPALYNELRALSQREGVTLFMTLLAAFQVLLARYSGQSDIAVGTPIANRTHAEIEGLIGFFVNTLVLRTDLAENISFQQLLGRVREVCLGAYAHQDVPFEKLVEVLQPERDLNRSPFFQVMLNLLHKYEIRNLAGELNPTLLPQEETATKFDLSFTLSEAPDRLYCTMEYNTDLFDPGTISRLLQHWLILLEAIVARPYARLGELPLLSEDERHCLLVSYNSTSANYPDSLCFPTLFDQQVARTPERIALFCHDEQFTFSYLQQRANQLAHYLLAHGVCPEAPIGLLFDRSPLMIISLLATLKAGGLYLPLDPSSPIERLNWILQDAAPVILLSEYPLPEPVSLSASLPHLCLSQEWSSLQTFSTEDPCRQLHPLDAAYILYTSGSTGTPKGVEVSHANLSNYLFAIRQRFDLEVGGHFAMLQPLTVDFCITMLAPALTSGSTLHLIDYACSIDPELFACYCQEHPIDYLKITPSHLAALLTSHSSGSLLPRRHLILGGEASSWSWVKELQRAMPAGGRVSNHYGPTEATVGVLTYSLSEASLNTEMALTPLGTPLSNTQVYVLDASLRPVPLGVVGELYLAGANLARGYLEQPALTALSFLPHPYSDRPGTRLYRTGDLVRYCADGVLQFVGRRDEQIKLRGFRIELGEIESVLSQHPAVRDIVVHPQRREPGGEPRLVAYVVLETGRTLTLEHLQQFGQRRLSDYMLPSALQCLERLPLSRNGKVARLALPLPRAWTEPETVLLSVARTPIEEVVRGLWCEVLGIQHIERDDNFFVAGGHSLLATQLISRLRTVLQVDIPLRSLFEVPTIAGLTEVVEQALHQRQGVMLPPIQRVQREQTFPLSFAQQRLWFLQQWDPDSSAYNIPVAIRLRGTLDVVALQRSLQELFQRHESLRTTFPLHNGFPIQQINLTASCPLLLLDLRDLSSSQQDSELHMLLLQEAQHSFDLANGPLVYTTLLRLADDEYVLGFTMHHIVSDAWSSRILVREIATLYSAFVDGKSSSLPALPIQYADFALWQRQWLQGEVLEGQIHYWQEQLAGLTPLNLPTDHPRPMVLTFEGACQELFIPSALSDKLRILSQQEGVTLFMTLLAAFQILLARYSGQSDIAVGTPIANRTHAEIEGLIGFFVNTLVLRTNLADNPSFQQLLARVREVCLGAYAHQDLPFEKLVEVLQPERDLSRSPLFQVMLSLQPMAAAQETLPDLVVTHLESVINPAKFDLVVLIGDNGQNLRCEVKYNTGLFEATTIARLLEHFRVLLETIVVKPTQSLAAYSMFSTDELQSLLKWSSRQIDSSVDSCLHKRFEQQVADSPDAIVVVWQEQQISYGRLNVLANQVAHYLCAQGVGPDVVVGLCVERSLEMLVGILGILKAGGAYLPLDPAYPTERLAFILDDAHIKVLLTHTSLLKQDAFRERELRLLCLDTVASALIGEPEYNPPHVSTPEHLAYVIYTSGSTGRPKGVLVSHANVARLFVATWEQFQCGSSDIWSCFHSYAFDFSVWELWGALLYGGRLCLVSYKESRSPDAFYTLVQQQGVTVLSQTPSAFQQFMQADEHAEKQWSLALRLVIFGGEAMDISSLRPWFERHGDHLPQLVNMYGITETTVHVTYRPLCMADASRRTPGSVIGKAIADLDLYVLDEHLYLAPVGSPGQICVGGAGLARGYLNRSDLTAERFVPHPFSTCPGARLYKTGDLARWLPAGELEYLGRADQQIKVRGFRIEPGEIEAILNQHSVVSECRVIMREDVAGDRRLVAYVVAKEAISELAGVLHTFLQSRLPNYMVPAHILLLNVLPLTSNGKLDRAALPTPGEVGTTSAQNFVAPRTPLERFLASLWQEILRLDAIGVHDNFFEAGGDSIKAAIFINRLQEHLKVLIQVVVIFDSSTIFDLVAYLSQHCPDILVKLFGQESLSETSLTSPQAERIDAAKLTHIRQLISPLPARNVEPEAKNPPAIFLLSPPRSGTTLLRVMLAGHPRLFAPPELELLSFNTLLERKAAYTGRDSFWLEGVLRAIMEIKGCDATTAKSIMDEYEGQDLSIQQFYRLLQEWLGERILVDKTATYALDRAILERAESDFTSAYYIHLLRHPYGMIRSFEEARLDQIFFRYAHPFSSRSLAELTWSVCHQNILAFLGTIPPRRQCRIYFEDLVQRPQAVLEGLCERFGLQFHADMLQPYQGSRMTDGIHSASRMLGDVKFHQHQGIDPGVAVSWQKQYSEDFLGDVTWELAESLGYQRDTNLQKRPSTLANSDTKASSRQLAPIEVLPRVAGQTFPLSFAQQRLWYLDQLEPGNAAYNIHTSTGLRGRLDTRALYESLQEILCRHESLRTTFQVEAGQPVQVIAASQKAYMPRIDLSALDVQQRQMEAIRLMSQEAQRPFELTSGPLLRTTLLYLHQDEQVLLATMHHIISDGWSMGILVREATTLYNVFVAGQPSPLQTLPVQYADFARWQRSWLQGEALEAQLAYWIRQLGGVPPLKLPIDHPRRFAQTVPGARYDFTLPVNLSNDLMTLSHQEGATVFMTLLAAFQTLLYRYTGQTDIVLGTDSANRTRAEVEPLIGFFVNLLALRASLRGSSSFREVLRHVREMVLEAYAHQDTPFEMVVERLQPYHIADQMPLVQALFVMQNTPRAHTELTDLTVSPLKSARTMTKFDMVLFMHEGPGGLQGNLTYNAALFEASTIATMMSRFEVLLQSIVTDPDIQVDMVQFYTDADKGQHTKRQGTSRQRLKASKGESINLV